MIVAICRAKDEQDIIASTVGHMLTQVDHVIVEDNGSTDGTLEILAGLDVEVLHDPTVGYYQSEAMSRLAEYARSAGATWVIPMDADELWLSCDKGTIWDTLHRLPAEALVAEASVMDHVATAVDQHDVSPVVAMAWRRAQRLPLRKVAVRAVLGVTIHQGNHGATFPGVRHPLAVTGALEVRHYPYRSALQMIRKARNGAAAYAATDLPEEVGAHWRGYGRLTDEQITEVFHKYFWSADPIADGLAHDPAPVACQPRA